MRQNSCHAPNPFFTPNKHGRRITTTTTKLRMTSQMLINQMFQINGEYFFHFTRTRCQFDLMKFLNGTYDWHYFNLFLSSTFEWDKEIPSTPNIYSILWYSSFFECFTYCALFKIFVRGVKCSTYKKLLNLIRILNVCTLMMSMIELTRKTNLSCVIFH